MFETERNKERKRRKLTEETRKVLIHLAEAALKGSWKQRTAAAPSAGARKPRLEMPIAAFVKFQRETKDRVQTNEPVISYLTHHTILSQRIMTGLFSQEKL